MVPRQHIAHADLQAWLRWHCLLPCRSALSLFGSTDFAADDGHYLQVTLPLSKLLFSDLGEIFQQLVPVYVLANSTHVVWETVGIIFDML